MARGRRGRVGDLRITVTDARGRPMGRRGLAAWLTRVAPRRARGHVAIALVSDGEMRTLNRRYRGVNRATDVLSFPAAAEPRAPHRRLLGDIVIARGVAARQAGAAGHSAADELKVLALHGLLHLLGYDHEQDSGEMARLERRLRRKGGL
jgi:probable rRNA maturation factor